MISTRMLGLAPRRTATRPATTPPTPASIASQRPTVATSADMCRDRRPHGGAAPELAIGGYIQLSRATDTAIMIRIELAMPAAASRVSSRVASPVALAGSVAGDPDLEAVALGMRLLCDLTPLSHGGANGLSALVKTSWMPDPEPHTSDVSGMIRTLA